MYPFWVLEESVTQKCSTRHLYWDKLRGLIKLGLEYIEGRGKASLKSSMLRSANIFIFVADQNSGSFKSYLWHFFLVDTLGWVVCLMPLG